MDYSKMNNLELIAELKRRDELAGKEETGKYKLKFQAGLLMAQSMETAIRNLAFDLDLGIKMQKEQLFLTMNYRVEVSGPVSKLETFKYRIEKAAGQVKLA